MSNFSQMMNDRSEARRIYNQRSKINQLELKNEKLQQEINKLTAESTEWESKYYDLQKENEELKQTLHNITINGVEEENTTVLDLIKEIKRLNNMIYREISDYILKKYGILDDTHYHDFLNELELKESDNNE